MRQFKSYFMLLAVTALLFTSCSKDGDPTSPEGEKATLSFATVLNDMVANKAALKDHLDVPACSDDAPAYVDVVLTGTTNVGTMAEPLRVNVNPNAADYDGDGESEYFTEEHASLQLDAGAYRLEYFVVRNADMDVIWVAPVAGSGMADWVDMALPMDFNLGNGVKKYVNVNVLCFDDRDVNEYGYLFFDINTNEGIEFCLFGNYCDENGRHFSAQYSVNVWSYANGARGQQIYADLENDVTEDANGDMAASPLCIALPDSEGMDEYYFEVTLMDGDDYDATPHVVRAGVISDEEVRSFFDGEDNLDYYHFRTGCDENDNVPVLQDPEDDAMFYKARVTELNDSNSFGLTYLRLDGNVLETTVLAYGTTPNRIHPQHIHGFEDGSNSTCPTAGADEDNDGLISLTEGAPFYGGVLLSLTQEDGTWPVADAWGMYTYSRTFHLGEGDLISAEGLDPLENRAIVIHGKMVGEEYLATLPVACGQIYKISQ